ncbi:unnamed protein product [Rotaria sordida]|uniref:Uncharacterized protein n=1 Tax=Rotaria sordida TaxID=392033 RepID=A0A815JNE7_9BILA|nr:unnamed protein product [Rotaria sordida]CAF3960682.1 unnamed protein product [Rotaria sordida]
MSSVSTNDIVVCKTDEIPSAFQMTAPPEQNVRFQSRNEESIEIQTPLPCITAENVSTHLNPDQDDIHDKQDERLSKTRTLPSSQNTNTESRFNDDPKKQQNIPSFTTLQKQRQQQLENDSDEFESFIDSNQYRPIPKKKYRLSYRSFIGTMSEIEEIYAQDDFLCGNKLFQHIFIFIDSVFRGIGQVMFANNPLSGIIIMIGLLIENWKLALYGLLGTCVSTLTAHMFKFNYNSIRAGLYGFNGCLVGMGIGYFSFPNSPYMIGPIVIMSIFSTIFFMVIGKILVQRLQISSFTFSFQICTWIWLLGALKYRYFFVNGTILSPNMLTTRVDKPRFLNVSFSHYSIQDNVVGFFTSIGQVYFTENPYTGIIILFGLCICSRILSFFAFFGAVTGQLTAAYLLGLPATAIHAGLWGFNSVLTCQALGGMFFVLYGYKIWFITFFGSIMTVLVQAAVSAFLAPVGMPTLTFPFTLVCWIFCLIAGSKDLIAVKLSAISIPEDHYHRFRLSKFIKTQFKFLNYFTNPSSSPDEDITIEEFTKIKAEFIPSLICSYVYRNDIDNLNMLVDKKVDIHSVDHNLRSPLHICACEGNMRLCKWLVEDCKVNVNVVDSFGGTPLFDAFWHGHFDLLQFLYTHGARMPACKEKELAFYLNAFVYEGNLEAIQCLITCGFDPNIGDYNGRNALHLAVITNQFNIVRYLVEETCARLDVADCFQQTPIEYASHLPNLLIADYLSHERDNSIPVKMPTEKLMHLETVVISGSDNKKQNKEEEEEEKTFSMSLQESLLPALFSMNTVHDDIKTISNFLEQFPHLNVLECVDYDFRSVAHVAAVKGQLENIRFFSQHCDSSHFKWIMNREDRWGISPIDEACRRGHSSICSFVNEHLVSQNDTTHREMPQLPESKFENNIIVRLLRKWKKIFRFSILAAWGVAEQIDGLFTRGYFNSTEIYADYDGRTPMHSAVANGHMNVVKVLLRYGYDGTTYKDRWGNYPIDEARRNQFYEIVDELEQPRVGQNFRECDHVRWSGAPSLILNIPMLFFCLFFHPMIQILFYCSCDQPLHIWNIEQHIQSIDQPIPININDDEEETSGNSGNKKRHHKPRPN